MSKPQTPATSSVRLVGPRKRIGAKRIGDKVEVTREVLSRDGDQTIVKFKTSTRKKALQKRGKHPDWMQNPDLSDKLLHAFQRAVNKAVGRTGTGK